MLGQPPVQAIVSALFTTFLAVIAIIDYEHMIIPDSLVISIAVLSIPGFALGLPPSWLDRLIGALAGFAILYLLAVLSEKILKKDGMGGGDIKLIAAAGLILGWNNLLSLGVGSVVALFMIVLMKLVAKNLNEEGRIPFGTPLAIAMGICHYFGNWMISWYLELVL